MKKEYTEEELQQLHTELYEILGEIVRICELEKIPYFIQGGTGIGAFFFEGIIPWDDDIDVGMSRANYERFLEVAPKRLGSDYFLQWLETDPETPFYFAKVRKNGTLFVEEDFQSLPIHHGIFVDIFPYDKVPDGKFLQRFQRSAVNFFNCCFMGKTQWRWRYFGKCEIAHPTDRGVIPCLLNRVVDTLFTKKQIYRMLRFTQSLFNGGKHTYYNMVTMPKDHIEVESIEHPQRMKFGPLEVWAPRDLETYLRRHYPGLRKEIPKEQQQNHRPIRLSFDVATEETSSLPQ